VPKPNPQAQQKRKTFSCLRDSDSKAIFLKICAQMSKRFCVGETFPSKRIISRKNAIQICLALITLIPTQNFQKKKPKNTRQPNSTLTSPMTAAASATLVHRHSDNNSNSSHNKLNCFNNDKNTLVSLQWCWCNACNNIGVTMALT